MAHRPWPLPRSSWVQGQTWEDLLFAHWRVDESELCARVPTEFKVDTHSGSAWLGVTPFRVSGLRLRGLLPLPLVSSFLELNVRTYVTLGGRPGIYFFSLDAESPLAVEAARATYHLPYHRARMSARRHGPRLLYESARVGEPAKAFSASYRPEGQPFVSAPGSLEHFLVERYCLYTLDGQGRAARAEIHHGPWSLQAADAEIELNTMAPSELELSDEPLLHVAARQDVVIWPLERPR